MSIDDILSDFNNTLTDLINNIADVCPDNLIADNKNLIKKVLSNKDNKTKAIDTFVAKVLIYKPEIDEGNESFFLGKSYENDLTDIKTESNITGKIFEFKNIWKGLSSDNKMFVIQYMQLLCMLAQTYFMLLDSTNN